VALLALASRAIASYLTYTRYADAQIMCTFSAGCEKVESSTYAVVAGVPVAVIGIVGYLAILVSCVGGGRRWALACVALAAGGMAFSAWLLAAQLFLIDAICQWCVASEVLMVAILVAALLRLRACRGEPRRRTGTPAALETASRAVSN